MRQLTATLPEEYNGRPLLHFLRGGLKLSVKITAQIRNTEGSVLVNGVPSRVVDRVFQGDTITVNIPEKTQAPLLCEMPLDILFEDDDLLVLNKPAGLAVHPTHNHPNGTLANGVANYLIAHGAESAAVRAVGRLDKGTSGVMVFAKNIFAASALNGKTEKIYIAIVCGVLEGEGTIDAPIFRPDPMKTLRAVGENGLPAVTHWRVLKQFGALTLVEIRLETGRTHQIRVHFASLGMPLLGDDMYGGPTELLARPALHCSEVTLLHPAEKHIMRFSAPIPPDLLEIIPAAKEVYNTYNRIV